MLAGGRGNRMPALRIRDEIFDVIARSNDSLVEGARAIQIVKPGSPAFNMRRARSLIIKQNEEIDAPWATLNTRARHQKYSSYDPPHD
jgi:hypothetical protein